MQKLRRVWVHHRSKPCRSLLVIFKRTAVIIAASLVSLTRGNTVHEHLNHILHRHLHTDDPLLGIHAVIKPIFVMMPVPPLVMQPGGRISLDLPLRIIRASGSLVILTSNQELRRHIF